MANEVFYKGVKIPPQLLGVIDHMADVERYREELRFLGSQWDLLTILGQMNGTGMDMTETHRGFQLLTSELLGQLGLETLKKTIQEIGSKAQVAVDIVIRNLFERTADIGFLATDDDIRAFLRSVNRLNGQIAVLRDSDGDATQVNLLNEARQDQTTRAAELVARFKEYVAKYSVYFNIILLDTRGGVLVQLDENNKIERSADPLIGEALSTSGEYVEAYGDSDLLEGREDSLIYAYRVTETDQPGSKALGVLCLCFRFENEMEGVFNNLRSKGDRSVMTLLDKAGRVIASSDKFHIPLGVTMDFDAEADFKLTQFAGREYLCKTCATKGYQGFAGLGWYGHVMIPLDQAFGNGDFGGLQQRVTQEILDAVMSDPRLFSDNLRSIPVKADRIQHELERTVWNGNVRESDRQSKVLLWNISDAGARTKSVFEQSIGNLHETVIGGILSDVEFQAALSVDIMDRNLYERANDCRWWALTSAFRRTLTKPEISAQEAKAMASILEYINGLYTVYTNLFLYDRNGCILAVSNPAATGIVGTVLGDNWVRETLALRDSQSYSVSSFEPSPLYDDRHTYIYGAAITAIDNDKHCVGGIGIVFDSEPQFREMLLDSLPRDENGAVLEGCYGIFADRNGRIISTTEDHHQVGQTLQLDPSFFALPSGAEMSRIVEYGGHYYAVGARTSAGYREYKVDDGYRNDVVGLVFVPLAEVAAAGQQVSHRRQMGTVRDNARVGGDESMEVATFYVGDRWLGINAAKVHEAINSDDITVVPGMPEFVVGNTTYNDKLIMVIDIRTQMGLPGISRVGDAPIVVLEAQSAQVGLLVDALGEIPEVSLDRVASSESFLDSVENYVECIIRPDKQSTNKELLVVLDPDRLVGVLLGEDVEAGARLSVV